MTRTPDLGEQALSKVAEIGLQSQLDTVEALEVKIQTDPLKLVQGKLDSVAIFGKGLVMEKDLRSQELQINTDHISVNPMKAALGEIELEHSTQAHTRIVLTEADIERAFNSDYIRSKLQNLEIQVEGRSTPIQTRPIKFRLPGDRTIALKTEVDLPETGETRQIALTAVPEMAEAGHQIVLEEVQYPEGNTAPELTDALLSAARELLDLRNFELTGMDLQLQSFDVQPGQICIEAKAQVHEFPGA
ncbi:MAG: DUF2993 domain-containing protein [Synechococcales bacterium]|nr:DUF2993 domain-containing protein [Synechococcales bacterium]